MRHLKGININSLLLQLGHIVWNAWQLFLCTLDPTLVSILWLLHRIVWALAKVLLATWQPSQLISPSWCVAVLDLWLATLKVFIFCCILSNIQWSTICQDRSSSISPEYYYQSCFITIMNHAWFAMSFHCTTCMQPGIFAEKRWNLIWSHEVLEGALQPWKN